jgi:DDE superfamily endonuclease
MLALNEPKAVHWKRLLKSFPNGSELGVLTDGTERPIRRPKDDEEQKEHYSGKKKRHTNKHVTITHPKTQRILAVSEEAPGTMHDKKILDEAQLSCTTSRASCVETVADHLPLNR